MVVYEKSHFGCQIVSSSFIGEIARGVIEGSNESIDRTK